MTRGTTHLLKASIGGADILLYGILSQNFYVSIIVFLGDAQCCTTCEEQYFHR